MFFEQKENLDWPIMKNQLNLQEKKIKIYEKTISDLRQQCEDCNKEKQCESVINNLVPKTKVITFYVNCQNGCSVKGLETISK